MFKVSKSKEAVAESNGSSFISDSGIYDVTINFASGEISKNGAEQVNFNVDYNGNSQVFYGPYVVNTDKSANVIGQQLINKLAIIAGMEEGDEPEIEQQKHKVGKDNKEVEFAVITQFSELPIKLRVQEEYSRYNGAITGKLIVKSFFSEDGASAEEIVNGTEPGVRLALEQDKYASHITYKDGLTADEVAEWKANKSSKSPTPTPSTSAAPKKLFGQR